MHLGTTDEAVLLAEKELGVVFPERLKEVWLISNGLELFGQWRLYPVFDRSDPRKTANHIVYENTKARWEYMPADYISIADNGTGNQLVLKKDDGALGPTIYFWDHETNKVRKWTKSFDDVFAEAKRRLEKINAQVSRHRS